ncbi:MAG: iron ABC transporter permease, partial [Lachnospiraceae bacterium]|nr:iron ABC transporter permease [Lachnospiraceae bacterium]
MRKKILSLVFLLTLCTLAGILLGSVPLSPRSVLWCLFGFDKNSTTYILVNTVRLPRVTGACLAGMGLAAAGVILQCVMNNSLASPNTIGVNSGAGFAVMLTLMLGGDYTSAVPGAAFVGALITTFTIFGLAYMADSSRTTIILAGITVSSFLNAGINTIKLLDTDITINLTTFMIGSLSGLTFESLKFPSAAIIAALSLSIFFAKSINVLSLGDDIARSLGLNVSLVRLILLVLSSILSGCVVSYAGLLSFVGLIVPHICRRLFGNDARYLLPCSALLGACFVLICDIMGRVLCGSYKKHPAPQTRRQSGWGGGGGKKMMGGGG